MHSLVLQCQLIVSCDQLMSMLFQPQVEIKHRIFLNDPRHILHEQADGRGVSDDDDIAKTEHELDSPHLVLC